MKVKPIIKAVKISELIEIVGGNKKYQIIAMIYFFMIHFIQAFGLTGFGLYFYPPDYICIDKDGAEKFCNKVQACSLNQKFRLDDKIKSLNYQFNLSCERESLALKANFIIFMLTGLVNVIYSLLNNIIGRKGMLMSSSCMIILAWLLEVGSNNFYLSCVSLFILLLCKIP